MSGGRWVRENNGDYQHYTDEEYNEKQRSEGVVTSVAMVVGGAIFAYVSITDKDFVFGDFSNGAFIAFCISGAALLLGAIILINTSSISEVIGYLVLVGAIAGVIYYVFSCGGEDKKKDKKEDNKEAISTPPIIHNSLITYGEWNDVHTISASLSQITQTGNLQNEDYIC